MSSAVVFGGSGFIGVFFAEHILKYNMVDKVYLFDCESLAQKKSNYRKVLFENDSRMMYLEGDVRRDINWIPDEQVSLIANFAAIHREPGHEDNQGRRMITFRST